ncbi:hypothetical protein MKO06_02900 [Gramella sp. GC03-9]|uniref:Uncharacterized protein n=1 Tax=Christiangramia oceanisediminis TaxID=2920386 RepID=A0A9X2KVV7_9FLAO|nr:hypothetical protein [Gramella oceanisediminis]MCP9198838.1 hypothetical protein [Gramella oceanisediminis]
MSRNEFYEPPGNNEYLAVYIEKDSITVGIRVQKEKYGRLEDSTFNALRLYLNSMNAEKIGEDDLIVINFLTGVTLEEQNRNARSSWNIFEGNYIRKLKKVADVSQYWISTLPKEKLKYFHSNKIDWKQDKQGMIPEVFSPYGLKYGYYIIIRPNGDYYYEIVNSEFGKKPRR